MGINALWQLLRAEELVEHYAGAKASDHAAIVQAVDGAAVAVDLAVWCVQADQQQALLPHFSREERCMKVAFERVSAGWGGACLGCELERAWLSGGGVALVDLAPCFKKGPWWAGGGCSFMVAACSCRQCALNREPLPAHLLCRRLFSSCVTAACRWWWWRGARPRRSGRRSKRALRPGTATPAGAASVAPPSFSAWGRQWDDCCKSWWVGGWDGCVEVEDLVKGRGEGAARQWVVTWKGVEVAASDSPPPHLQPHPPHTPPPPHHHHPPRHRRACPSSTHLVKQRRCALRCPALAPWMQWLPPTQTACCTALRRCCTRSGCR